MVGKVKTSQTTGGFIVISSFNIDCVVQLSTKFIGFSGNAHPHLCVWELKDFDNDNNWSGAGGKLCL